MSGSAKASAKKHASPEHTALSSGAGFTPAPKGCRASSAFDTDMLFGVICLGHGAVSRQLTISSHPYMSQQKHTNSTSLLVSTTITLCNVDSPKVSFRQEAPNSFPFLPQSWSPPGSNDQNTCSLFCELCGHLEEWEGRCRSAREPRLDNGVGSKP